MTQQSTSTQTEQPLDINALVDSVAPSKYDAVTAEPDSRLDQLIAARAMLKPQADELAARLKALNDAIKLELIEAAPDSTAIEVRGTSGPALRLVHSTSWRLDSTRLKAVDPVTWVRYAKQSGSWTLKAVGGGQ